MIKLIEIVWDTCNVVDAGGLPDVLSFDIAIDNSNNDLRLKELDTIIIDEEKNLKGNHSDGAVNF